MTEFPEKSGRKPLSRAAFTDYLNLIEGRFNKTQQNLKKRRAEFEETDQKKT